LSSDEPVTKQMMEVYNHYGECVVALEEVPDKKISRYGIVKGKEIKNSIYLIDDIVEKPSMGEAPSNLAVSGRYIFNADIFEKIAKTPRGKNNEVQITDAMKLNLKEHAMYGFKFKGQRHDIGNILDYIKTNIFFGLRNDAIKDELLLYIKELAKDI
jgi:UTP--glucose-1-phosphate uridylyltransferase